MSLSLTGEVVGYIGRILLNKNPFDPTGNDFLLYLVPLTISPAFLSAAIYLCLACIVVIYGEQLSRFKPGTYTIIFCGCDIFALVLQALGGGIASGAKTQSKLQLGINVMLAGLSVQVASLTLFALMCAEFAWRLHSHRNAWRTDHAAIYNSRLFKSFLIGLCVATLTIFIRSVFRVAEVSGGFHGPLANNQVSFMVLEGAMIVVATSCLTGLHPGYCFQGAWHAADFSFGKGKVLDEDTEMS
ncbi:RTA1 like protein [Mollisia scopiformis]|uniref:RTA1 like protein n=1 Tax=Mollisia scopiformis TaxID=149040 RepID=A0A194X2Z4_MOLSC|nr:RTA1 like protein [Mollisia scopiformis]KUJ14558.1 RTA1 like protein [Mollisia scopiformis]